MANFAEKKNKLSALTKQNSGFLDKAKVEGRFFSVKSSLVFVDPEQPRKTFSQAKLDELRESIQQNGQLQPILVVKENDGYKIIAGERRWRAISENGTKDNVIDIVVNDRSSTEKEVLLMQISENNQRENVTALENAEAAKRVVDLSSNQAEAATDIGISKAQLSKLLTLVKAPELVKNLSLNGDSQDIEVLYNLSKAAAIDERQVEGLINAYETGELTTNLRVSSKELLQELKKPKEEVCEPESNEPESNEPESNEPESNEPESNEPESNEPERARPVKEVNLEIECEALNLDDVSYEKGMLTLSYENRITTFKVDKKVKSKIIQILSGA